MNIDLKNFCPSQINYYEFSNFDLAFTFYEWYGKTNGFSVRKGTMLKSNKSKVLQQQFTCYIQGLRHNTGLKKGKQKRRSRKDII